MKTEELRIASFFFVAALIASTALIFVFGALGLHGNSAITGSYLLISLLGLLLTGHDRSNSFSITPMDWVFATFVGAIAIGSVLHFSIKDYKEYILLIISDVFGYVAGRSLSSSVIGSVRLRLLQISTPVVIATCIATIPPLITEINTRPFVFGFSHASTVFCITFGYMVVSYVHSNIEWRSKISLFYFILVGVATTVFAASKIRFVLFAIMIATLFSFACSLYDSFGIRRRVTVVLLAVAFGVIVGTLSRYNFLVSGTALPGNFVVKVERLSKANGGNGTGIPGVVLPAPPSNSDQDKKAQQHVSPVERDSAIEPPSCNIVLDPNDSISIRRVLLGDALFYLPKAGFFGFGLNSFSRMTCLEGFQIHNSAIQAIVEFGWTAGLALIALMGIPLKSLLFKHRVFELDSQFLLSCLVFSILLSFVYGQISRELSLFLFLGSFAKATSNSRKPMIRLAGASSSA